MRRVAAKTRRVAAKMRRIAACVPKSVTSNCAGQKRGSWRATFDTDSCADDGDQTTNRIRPHARTWSRRPQRARAFARLQPLQRQRQQSNGSRLLMNAPADGVSPHVCRRARRAATWSTTAGQRQAAHNFSSGVFLFFAHRSSWREQTFVNWRRFLASRKLCAHTRVCKRAVFSAK